MTENNAPPARIRRSYSAAEFGASVVMLASVIGGALWLGALSATVQGLEQRVPSSIPPNEVVSSLSEIKTRLGYVEDQLDYLRLKVEGKEFNELDPQWRTLQ